MLKSYNYGILLICILFLTKTPSTAQMNWLYDAHICTGLGDRLGFIVSLSALARLNNGIVFIYWCEDAQLAILENPLLLKYIPKWTGWDYPLETVMSHLSFPSNVQFLLEGGSPKVPYRLVTLNHEAPAIQGVPWTRTLFYKALKLADGPWNREEYEQAYLDAGREVTAKAEQHEKEGCFVLVHFRYPDHNTHKRDESSFCTRRVIRRLQAAGVHMKVISNNHTLSLLWLQGLPFVQIVKEAPPWMDMQLSLRTVAIVQHASEGWSSYTSVPAMARGTPLINTYTGINHRYSFFEQYGDLPSEFFTCANIGSFVRTAAVMSKRLTNSNNTCLL